MSTPQNQNGFPPERVHNDSPNEDSTIPVQPLPQVNTDTTDMLDRTQNSSTEDVNIAQDLDPNVALKNEKYVEGATTLINNEQPKVQQEEVHETLPEGLIAQSEVISAEELEPTIDENTASGKGLFLLIGVLIVILLALVGILLFVLLG